MEVILSISFGLRLRMCLEPHSLQMMVADSSALEFPPFPPEDFGGPGDGFAITNL